MKKITLVLGGALALAAAPAHASVIGTADAANGLPFGGNTGYYFQQIYSASAFGSALDISRLSFYNTVLPGGAPLAGDFEIWLSTTAYSDIAGFDTSTAGVGGSPSWLPADGVKVYSSAAPALSGGTLDFDLSEAFSYDPTQGSLLLTVRNLNLHSGASTIYLDVDEDSPVTNYRFSAYGYDFNQGLVTGFNEGVTAAVPEPSTWAMMIGGFALVGGVMRRRRRVSVSFA